MHGNAGLDRDHFLDQHFFCWWFGAERAMCALPLFQNRHAISVTHLHMQLVEIVGAKQRSHVSVEMCHVHPELLGAVDLGVEFRVTQVAATPLDLSKDVLAQTRGAVMPCSGSARRQHAINHGPSPQLSERLDRIWQIVEGAMERHRQTFGSVESLAQ